MGAYRDAFSKAATGGIRDGINRLGWLKDIAGYMMDGEYEEAVYAVYNASRTSPVGTKKANELGLNDMSGNVNEWCWDWDGTYPSNDQTNPVGPINGSMRIARGGSWGSTAYDCRISARGSANQSGRFGSIGFRVVRRDLY